MRVLCECADFMRMPPPTFLVCSFVRSFILSPERAHTRPFSARTVCVCVYLNFVGNVRFVLHSFIKSPMRHNLFFSSLTRCERVCTCIFGEISVHIVVIPLVLLLLVLPSPLSGRLKMTNSIERFVYTLH